MTGVDPDDVRLVFTNHGVQPSICLTHRQEVGVSGRRSHEGGRGVPTQGQRNNHGIASHWFRTLEGELRDWDAQMLVLL